mgnify:FL=1
MELIKNKYKIRCEMGACRNMADYVLVMDRSGIHSSICMCGECAEKLKEALCSEPKEKPAGEMFVSDEAPAPVVVRKKRKSAGISAENGEEIA